MVRAMSVSLLVLTPCLVALACSAGGARSTVRCEMIAMRDGVKLATDVYLPASGAPAPVILVRTPYGKAIYKEWGEELAEKGYAAVAQDVRGRFASDGEYRPFDADGWGAQQDGRDTLAWIAAQPWCNGRIGLTGGSAMSMTQLGALAAGGAPVSCFHLAVAPASLYNFVYRDGVLRKEFVEGWLRDRACGEETLRTWSSHPLLDGYWQVRDATPRLSLINAPGVHIGAWYDMWLQDTIDTFCAVQARGGALARGRQKLLISPGTHAAPLVESCGPISFPNGSQPPTRAHDALLWFDHHLRRADNGVAREPAVTYYVMGDATDPQAPGNCWRTADHWPPVPTVATRFHLHSDLSLARSAAASGRLAYDYDPDDPVPSLGAGPIDQQAIERRSDVLVFSTAPLVSPVEVTGRVRVKLWASISTPDTDLVARVCDVYPDGRSINVCEGVVRARLRRTLSAETALEPGRPYLFDIDLWTTSIVFNKGHRIRLHITSSCSPRYAANSNSGKGYPHGGTPCVAHITVFAGPDHPSHLLLPIAPSEKPPTSRNGGAARLGVGEPPGAAAAGTP